MGKRNISLILKKRPWKRLVTADADVPYPEDIRYYDIPTSEPEGVHCQYLTNAGLLNETTEGAHLINEKYQSTRPIYELREHNVTTQDEDGKDVTKAVKEYVISGYEPIETVRSGLANCICATKASHFAQNGIEIANEGKDHERFDNFRAWKDLSGIDTAWLEAIYACCKCGDAAIYPYIQGNTIEYKVFSWLTEDHLAPGFDESHKPTMARGYMLNGHHMVDYFTTTSIETWVEGSTDGEGENEENKSWLSTIINWFKRPDYAKSEDGWTRVNIEKPQTNKDTLQVIYLRFQDTPVGGQMQNINGWEKAASYVSDKVKSTAFSKLFMKAPKFVSLPELSSGEEVYGVQGDIEALKASDMKYVAPPDISNIATIDLKNKVDAIMQSTLSIDLQPDILKSGADSSTTLKLLLRREIQWCHITWPVVRKQAKQVIEVLKQLVAILENDGEYAKLKISVWNTPWIPLNETENVSNVEKLVYAGVLSKENARHELNMQYTDDVKRVNQEAEEELYRKTFIPAKAKAEAEKQYGTTSVSDDIVVDEEDENQRKNKVTPKPDNRADRRDIANNEPQ